MNASERKQRAGELLPWAERCATTNTDAWLDTLAILRAVAGGEVGTAEKGFRVLTDNPITTQGRVLVIQGD